MPDEIKACYDTLGRRGHVLCTCASCGKQLKRILSRYRKVKNHFCSKECSNNSPCRTYEYNTTFFKENNELSAYFLGLFVTDGNLSKTKVTSFSLTDKQIIDDLAKVTGYNRPIREAKQPKGKKLQYVLTYSGPLSKWIHELDFPYGPKTGLEHIPVCITETTFKHFLRGVIDGDGSFFLHNSCGKGLLNCKLVSASKEFVSDILSRLRDYKIVFGGGISIYHTKNREMYTLLFGHNDSRRIGDFIYDKDCTLFLRRKLDTWKKHSIIVVDCDVQKNRTCSINECTRPARTCGLCLYHYNMRYRKDHEEKRREYMSKYAEEHREERKEYMKKYSIEHKEEKLAYMRKRWQDNKRSISSARQ